MAEVQVTKARAQLAQVLALLKEEPSNPELLYLANDLREAVAVAEALVLKESQGPKSTPWTVTTTSKPTGAGSTATSQAGSSSSLSMPPALEFLVNDHVEIRQHATSKLWQGGVVLKRLPDYTYVVSRVCDGKELTIPRAEHASETLLRPCVVGSNPLKHGSLVPGMRLRARYSGDGKYYEASVVKLTSYGALMTFKGFEDDDPEQVLVEHLRENEPGEGGALLAGSVLPLPKHLVVKESDTDEVRVRKQRQAKAWRKQVRDEAINQVHAVKQDQWLSFQASSHDAASKRMKTMGV